MIYWAAFATVALSFALAVLATPLARRVAYRVGMVDVPQRHKAHATPTPLLGGSAIFAAILVPSVMAAATVSVWASRGAPAWMPDSLAVHISGAAMRAPMALGILACAFVLHVVGIIDDRRNLGPWLKLTAQIVVAAATVLLLDVRVLTVAGGPISAIASILWIVAITNSFNFLDNMDGLSAGVAAICAAALLAAAAGVGQLFVGAWLCLILGALLGFLLYNFPPASVFMGDAGSLVVGYMLAVISMLATYVRPDTYIAYGVLVPVVLMAVPLYDTFSVIAIRIAEKRNPMIGDRRHFSHRLVKRGMGQRTAVLTIYLCTAATAMGATLLPHVRGWFGGVMVLAQTACVLLIIALLERGDSRA